MKLITLYLPEPYIKALKRMVDTGHFPNRAEAIRTAIRMLMKERNEFLNSIVIKPIDNTENDTEKLPKKERRKVFIYTSEKP